MNHTLETMLLRSIIQTVTSAFTRRACAEKTDLNDILQLLSLVCVCYVTDIQYSFFIHLQDTYFIYWALFLFKEDQNMFCSGYNKLKAT